MLEVYIALLMYKVLCRARLRVAVSVRLNVLYSLGLGLKTKFLALVLCHMALLKSLLACPHAVGTVIC